MAGGLAVLVMAGGLGGARAAAPEAEAAVAPATATAPATPAAPEAEGRTAPAQVKLGAYITHIYDLDIAKRSFNVAFWAWFHHGDPKYKPTDTVEIVNAKQTTTRYPAVAQTEGGYWSQAKYYATISKDWDIRHYPFDRQTLDIYLEDGQADVGTQVLVADVENSGVDSAIIIPGWTVEGFTIKAHNVAYKTTFGDPSLSGESVYSRVTATVIIKRDGVRLLTSVFIGFFVAFFMSSLTYFLDFKHMAGARISLCAGGIFASAGNKFAVDNILTPGGVFTLADGIEISTFCAILCAILTVVSLRLIAEKYPVLTRILNALIGVSAVGTYLAFNGYVIASAIAQ